MNALDRTTERRLILHTCSSGPSACSEHGGSRRRRGSRAGAAQSKMRKKVRVRREWWTRKYLHSAQRRRRVRSSGGVAYGLWWRGGEWEWPNGGRWREMGRGRGGKEKEQGEIPKHWGDITNNALDDTWGNLLHAGREAWFWLRVQRVFRLGWRTCRVKFRFKF